MATTAIDATTSATATRLPSVRAAPRGRPQLTLVINRRATGVTRELGDEARRALRRWGASVDVLTTESAAEGREAAESGGRVVLLGGDGTVHAAANLDRPPRQLALIAAGSANNIARSLGIPLQLDDAARLAVEGRVHPIDLIEATSRRQRYRTVEGVSVGFLAQARVRYHEENSSHLAAGLAAGMGALRRFHPLAVRVERAGASERLELGQLFVANLALYEFGLRVAPFADPTDGLLDLIGIEVPSRLAVPGMILRLLRARHVGRTGVHVWRAPWARIETHELSPVVADSTDLGPGPVELAVVPRGLPIVRPR
jgi:diacylglycerol kinase (ATP)